MEACKNAYDVFRIVSYTVVIIHRCVTIPQQDNLLTLCWDMGTEKMEVKQLESEDM